MVLRICYDIIADKRHGIVQSGLSAPNATGLAAHMVRHQHYSCMNMTLESGYCCFLDTTILITQEGSIGIMPITLSHRNSLAQCLEHRGFIDFNGGLQASDCVKNEIDIALATSYDAS